MDNQKSKTSKTDLQKSKNSNGIKIPITENGIAGSTELKMKLYTPQNPRISKDKTAFQGLCHFVLATRKRGEWNTEFEPELLRDMLDERGVTVREAITAFKKAYSDHYTPSSGIEWRHLWKHIEEMRMGKDRQYYTYKEMLNICDKESITTDHFEFIDKDKFRRK